MCARLFTPGVIWYEDVLLWLWIFLLVDLTCRQRANLRSLSAFNLLTPRHRHGGRLHWRAVGLYFKGAESLRRGCRRSSGRLVLRGAPGHKAGLRGASRSGQQCGKDAGDTGRGAKCNQSKLKLGHIAVSVSLGLFFFSREICVSVKQWRARLSLRPVLYSFLVAFVTGAGKHVTCPPNKHIIRIETKIEKRRRKK